MLNGELCFIAVREAYSPWILEKLGEVIKANFLVLLGNAGESQKPYNDTNLIRVK